MKSSEKMSVKCSDPPFYTLNWSKLSSSTPFSLPLISYLSKKISQKALEEMVNLFFSLIFLRSKGGSEEPLSKKI